MVWFNDGNEKRGRETILGTIGKMATIHHNELEEVATIHYNGLIEEFKAIGIDASINYNHLINMWWNHDPATLYYKDEKVVGFITEFVGESMIYIDPDYQRLGIGSELLNETDIDTVWVMKGNTKAENFYKKNGFKPTDSRETTKLGYKITEVKWVKDAVQEEKEEG